VRTRERVAPAGRSSAVSALPRSTHNTGATSGSRPAELPPGRHAVSPWSRATGHRATG
jgi:hypothetical protein